MNLQIDNFDGRGLLDYTAAVDGTHSPQVVRKLNQISTLRFSLAWDGADLAVPVLGAHVMLVRSNGQYIFTGYLMQAPAFEYLGWGERGPMYRYNLVAQSDEALLDEKRLPERCPFVERSAGSALEQLTQDAMPGAFDISAVQNVDTLAWYASDPQKTWSQQAAEIAIQARGSYRCLNGALGFLSIGTAIYALNESDADFSPQGLLLQPVTAVVNDVTVIGDVEPEAYVSDYYVGDGLTERFYLSQTPFTKTRTTLFDEEYTVSPLEPTVWSVIDPSRAVSVSGGKLQIAGGTGADGATTVQFVEKIELGGATVLQHGDVMFNAASTGVLGGLFPGTISIAGCLAGFQVTPNGAQSNIQAVVNGVATGTAIPTVTGHHYVLNTLLYSLEIYRRQQIFHSSTNPAGNGRGGAEIAADVRVVLEIHDIDPTNPASQVAAAAVLYDGLISGAPGFCTYVLVNAASVHCAIAFSRLVRAVDAEVRSALPGQSYTTLLVGALSDGAACNVTNGELEFFSSYVPASNQLIEVHYRGSGRGLARVTNPANITALQKGLDNGEHGAVRHVKTPLARTAVDCENAALTVLDDGVTVAWAGEYSTWSDFLPGNAADIFPGDALNINIPSRGAAFQAIVRAVDISVKDLGGEHSLYSIKFANDSAETVSFEFQAAIGTSLDVTAVTNAQVGTIFLADLTAAVVTQVTSTTISLDAGTTLPTGGGVEVRWSDQGWGPDNDRNLVGRFSTQTFTVPRLTRVQTFFLQQFDASVPPKYSRLSASLHVDYPL